MLDSIARPAIAIFGFFATVTHELIKNIDISREILSFIKIKLFVKNLNNII